MLAEHNHRSCATLLAIVILMAAPASAQIRQSMDLYNSLAAVASSDTQSAVINDQGRPQPGHLFITAAAIADFDRLDYIDGGGAAPTGSLGIGVTLSSRFDLRSELDIPGWHRHHNSANGPPVAFEDNTATRTTTLALLLGRHFGQRRDITLVIGGSLLAHQFKTSGFWERLNADGTVIERTSGNEHSMDYRAGLTLGVDAPFPLSQRVAFVPQLRVHQLINGHFGETLPRGYNAIRAGVALRVGF